MDTFGAILKRTIKESGYTQQEFADETNIGLSSLKKYMSDKNLPDINTLMVICEKLDCSYDYLLGYSKVPERENSDFRTQSRLSTNAAKKILECAESYDTSDANRLIIDSISTIVETGTIGYISMLLGENEFLKEKMNELIKSILQINNSNSMNEFTDALSNGTAYDSITIVGLIQNLTLDKSYYKEHFARTFKKPPKKRD